MRLLPLILMAFLVFQTGFALDRGVKAGNLEDVILVGADDWHSSVAATPLAIWTEENRTVTNPLLILPREVGAGDRMGWVEQEDLDRYGVTPVLHTLTSANVSAIVVHGYGDLTKSMVKTAKKEGIKAYVTVTLEPAIDSKTDINDIEKLYMEDELAISYTARDMFFEEMGLTAKKAKATASEDASRADPDDLARDRQLYQVDATSGEVGELLCPVNPDVREELYDHVEEIIEDYKADGIVLYEFGFQNEDYCFCEICKEEFYKDTGIDLTKVYTSRYNTDRWKRWREEQTQEMVDKVRNITADLGPVSLGVAVGNPLERNQGYNFAEITRYTDFAVVSPIPPSEVELATRMTDTPVYVRLSDDYVEYTISTQNVEGTISYIEDVVKGGAAGLAFEYNVVYTPLWYELEPPSRSARWLLERLGGTVLCVGDVSWDSDARIVANDSYEMAARISERWDRSPGVVLVGDNYSAALSAATVASYLNWPLLFVGQNLTDDTASAISRLGAGEAVVVGPITPAVTEKLKGLNLTVTAGDAELLMNEMAEKGDMPDVVVFTNSHDLSLIPPRPEVEIKRTRLDDIRVGVEISPNNIPSDRAGEIVRMNVTVSNIGDEDVTNLVLVDLFPSGRYVGWMSPSAGEANVTDPLDESESTRDNAFFDGSMLIWTLDRLGPDDSAYLNLETEILHPLAPGWTQPLDSGITVTHDDLEQNVTMAKAEDWPITTITYPESMPVGIAKVSWKVEKTPEYTGVKVYGPDDWVGSVEITECKPNKTYTAALPFKKPGEWKFNIVAGNGFYHSTENFTVDVVSSVPPLNVTAFSHTKVPRLSLASSQIAAARKAILLDVAKDPQEMDPLEAEEDLRARVDEMELDPEYMIVVGGPGSMPFIPTGLKQELSSYASHEIYREYQLQRDDDNFTEVAVGRIIGLSVYDASQMVARTLAYDRLEGPWKDGALVVSSPAEWPWNPVPLRIGEYLAEAGMDVINLRWEEATTQRVSSLMNNGQNMVLFDHHGNENAWQLSQWSMMDSALDEAQVKELVLAPQSTTSNGCLTSRLNGFSVDVGGTDMYIPTRLDDSIALAFIRAGAVNYIGSGAFSWIFISDDQPKRLYQALVFENATVGQALQRAENLFVMKAKATEDIGGFDKMEEALPSWQYSVMEMLNQTSKEYVLFGDPTFRPALPEVPDPPYTATTNGMAAKANASEEDGEVELSITPTSETATDWLYWIGQETTGGKVRLNAPPAIIGEILLPKDAEEIVVKEKGRVVWHDEDVVGNHKRVIWPVVRPRLGENRTFLVEYRVVPGESQVITVNAGWNLVALYLEPADPSLSKYFKSKPYRGIFAISERGWEYTLKDSGVNNLTTLEPGRGYMIDSSESFTVEVAGKPVELPYRLKLHQGWNVVGLPMNETIRIENVTVNAEHRRYSYPEAVREGMISAFLWRYDGEDWGYLGSKDEMVPGEAYLVEAMNECRLEFR